jgi:hypothetical protein
MRWWFVLVTIAAAASLGLRRLDRGMAVAELLKVLQILAPTWARDLGRGGCVNFYRIPMLSSSRV